TVAVLFEGHRLDGEIEDLTTDDHANEAEQATRNVRNVGIVLGSVLHALEPKTESRRRNLRFSNEFAGF
ncbi:hypothetical protein HWN75_27550, partial [Escherichia coli]|nr:hypothetical protein [Escherichia coli]